MEINFFSMSFALPQSLALKVKTLYLFGFRFDLEFFHYNEIFYFYNPQAKIVINLALYELGHILVLLSNW
jgi:hypothetical protein